MFYTNTFKKKRKDKKVSEILRGCIFLNQDF
jgi:hypothetical protein